MQEKKLIGMVYEGVDANNLDKLQIPQTIRGTVFLLGGALLVVSFLILTKLSNIEKELKKIKK